MTVLMKRMGKDSTKTAQFEKIYSAVFPVQNIIIVIYSFRFGMSVCQILQDPGQLNNSSLNIMYVSIRDFDIYQSPCFHERHYQLIL